MARPHIEPYVELNDDYAAFSLSNFPAGSQYKVLSLDEDTGACSLKMLFNAGYTRPPGMSYSDAELFVLEGRVKIGEQTYGRGQYFFIPAGIFTPQMYSADGFEALVFYNDGPPTFIESDEHHELALHEAFVSTNAYLDAPWLGTARRNPGVASGFFGEVAAHEPGNQGQHLFICGDPGIHPGQYLLSRLRRRGVPHPRRLLDDAVRRAAHRGLLLATAIHQSWLLLVEAWLHCAGPN